VTHGNKVVDNTNSLDRPGLDLQTYGDPNAIGSDHYLEVEKRFRRRMLHRPSALSPATMTGFRLNKTDTSKGTRTLYDITETSHSDNIITSQKIGTKSQGIQAGGFKPMIEVTRSSKRRDNDKYENDKMSGTGWKVMLNRSTYSEDQLKKDMFYWRKQALGR
jgi:hypothetical protein